MTTTQPPLNPEPTADEITTTPREETVTNEAPEPKLDAVLIAQQFLGWNGNRRDATLTNDRVSTEAVRDEITKHQDQP